ncbi:hypothetical protein Bhyg_04056 [Pseudolycoriella hygida]|uniref:Uncharacterized protein n=1 Tax=Pseudolycoriella hygida TaxID=35572 RepID=A0A9Q0NEH9_9DIPT|nr:hypothetical protein Bhyg_04056 [Pseudolycoriella hygida]
MVMFAVYAECGPLAIDDDKQPRNPPPFEDCNTFPYNTVGRPNNEMITNHLRTSSTATVTKCGIKYYLRIALKREDKNVSKINGTGERLGSLRMETPNKSILSGQRKFIVQSERVSLQISGSSSNKKYVLNGGRTVNEQQLPTQTLDKTYARDPTPNYPAR